MNNLWLAIISSLIGLFCLIVLSYGTAIYFFEGIQPNLAKMLTILGVGLFCLVMTIVFAKKHSSEKRR